MRIFVVLCVAALLPACKTEQREKNATGMWAPAEKPIGTLRTQEPEPEPERRSDATVVTIPPAVASKHEAFLARPATLYADVVEIDASRLGWLASAAPAFSREAVERSDQEDPVKGVLTITLARRPDVAAQVDSVPTVRFGNGLRIVGVDRIVMRFWAQQSADRPLWFQAVGTGKKSIFALDVQDGADAASRREGKVVKVRSEIRKQDGEYRYDESVEGSP